jgi:hypothetical protein
MQPIDAAFLAKFVMPGLVPGIHVLATTYVRKAWMAGTMPGHDDEYGMMPKGSNTKRLARP